LRLDFGNAFPAAINLAHDVSRFSTMRKQAR
jgi:hypothetical protein